MDSNEIREKYSLFFRQHFLSLALGSLGLIFLGYGLMHLSPQKQDAPDILFEAAKDVKKETDIVNPSTGYKSEKEIVVDIEGAVLKPGVYTLVEDARVQDGLIAAGGLSDKADHVQVEKTMNLASKLTDGAKLYIPYTGEQTVASGGNIAPRSETTGLISLNNATSKELDSLPGVGMTTAEKIINNRPYASVEELIDKKIVGKSVFEKIKDKISI